MAQNSTNTQPNPQLATKEIQDIYVKKNFDNMVAYFKAQNQLLNFRFFDLVFSSATSNFLVAHGFTYIPQDVLVTKIIGPGTVTFNYGLFDGTNVNITTSGACRVRFFVGTYWNFQTVASSSSSDLAQFISVIPSTTQMNQPLLATTSQTIAITTPLVFASSSSAITLTLPNVSAAVGQGIFRFQNNGTSTVTIQVGKSSDYIGFTQTPSISLYSQGDFVELVSNGTAWLILASKRAPIITVFTAGSGNFTSLNGTFELEVIVVGGGAGGSGGGNLQGGLGGLGGTSSFGGVIIGVGGNPGTINGGGGVGTLGSVSLPAIAIEIGNGSPGQSGMWALADCNGGDGGDSYYSGAGQGRGAGPGNGPGGSAIANSGCGGGGASNLVGTVSNGAGGGGSGGGWARARIPNPQGSYAWVVGAGGTAGATGGAGVGGVGGSGRVTVITKFQ
jgi:hypothetical protein